VGRYPGAVEGAEGPDGETPHLCSITQCSPTGRSHDNQRAAGINRPFFDEAAVKQVLRRAAKARQDVAEVSTALRIECFRCQ
jgi:hypothetical protein